MKRKPEEEKIISYLYGEISEKDRREVEDYLKDNSEARDEIEELKKTRELLNKFEDEEVVGRPNVFSPQHKSFFVSKTFRSIVSIAAAILLLMIVGRVTDLSIKYGESKLTITFGDGNEQITEGFISRAEVDNIINEKISHSQKNLEKHLVGFENRLDSVESGAIGYIDNQISNKVLVSQRQIDSYVAQLDRESKEKIGNYFRKNTLDQEIYMQTILTDFANYMEIQRGQDLEELTLYVNNLDKKTTQNQIETNQLLSSIISTVNYAQGE